MRRLATRRAAAKTASSVPSAANPSNEGTAEPAWIETLVRAVRRHPERFADESALTNISSKASGTAPSRAPGAAPADLADLDGELRRLYHSTPARLLLDARLTKARELLLRTDLRPAALAADLGFPSAAAFESAFRRAIGLPPRAYRALLGARSLTLDLPSGYPTARILRYLGREHDSLSVRVQGTSVVSAARIDGRPFLLRARLGPSSVAVEVELRSGRLRATDATRALELARRLLGLARSPDDFEARIAGDPRLAPLLEGRRGLRIPQVADAFDGLIWVIVGQQISLPFAYALRRALIELAGEPAGDGLSTPPTPARVAELEPEALTALRYSRRKAEYLIGVARLLAEGSLRLEELADAPAPTVAARLLAVRGLGPWSVQYLLMRVFGFEDCMPIGDAGLARALQRFFALEAPPAGRRMEELMAPFAPHRSWATFYLWQSLEKVATTETVQHMEEG